MKFKEYFFNSRPVAEKPEQETVRKRKKFPNDAIVAPIDRISMELNNLKEAVDSAIDVYNPNRDDLLLLYYWAMKDDQVKSQFEIAVNKVASQPFKIWKGDTEVDDLKYLFKKPWFDDYIRLMIEAELWGYTLLEFQEMKGGIFTGVKPFPRRYVNPAWKMILSHPTHTQGIKYDAKMLADFWMIESGDNDNQGSLELITKHVMYKNYALVDWSDFNERYGKPILSIKTDTDDNEEVQKRARMAANFGSNLWLVSDLDDEIDILEAKNISSNAETFNRMISMQDDSIAKIINGTKGVGDEQAWVGTAEVNERVLNDFTKTRLRRISNHLNYELFPFLVRYGYPLADCTFEFIIEEKATKIAESEPDNKTSDPVNFLLAQKKNFPGKGLKLDIEAARTDQVLNDWLLRFFEGRALGIDYDIWKLNFQSLVKSLTTASISFSPEYKYAELATALRQNAAVYAAFKNHDEQKQLIDLLTDAKGEPVNWSTFKKLAKPITEKYNKEWLQTEFKQAQASAQMAVKWEGFKEEADLYPNLKYEAVDDKFSRPSHSRMNGTVRPINDSFWNRNYPPNGWGCRCTVTQTDEEVTPVPNAGADADFRYNPGKDRKLFDESNGFKTRTKEDEQATVQGQADQFLNQYLSENE